MSDSGRNLTHCPGQHSSGLYLLTPLVGRLKINVTGDVFQCWGWMKADPYLLYLHASHSLSIHRTGQKPQLYRNIWEIENEQWRRKELIGWLFTFTHTHRNSIMIMHPSLCFSCLPFPFLSATCYKLEFIQSQYITHHISLVICMINLMNLRHVLSKSRKTTRSALHW